MRISTLFASLLLAAVLPAQTTTYWVDANTGADTNPGTAAKPFRSITHAVGVGQRDAIIRVRPGTYSPTKTGEVFTIQFTGAHQNVTLIGTDTAKCIVDFEQAVGSLNAFYFYVASSAANIEIAHLTLTNGAFRPAVPWYSSAIWWTDVQGFELHHCRIENCESGIYSSNGSQDVSVHDNVFVGNNVPVRLRQDAAKGAKNVRFFNNVISASATGFPDKVSLSGKDPNQIVVNNISINNPGQGFNYKAQQGLVFENNIAFGNTTDFVVNGGNVPASNRTVDPKLVNPANGDFRQQASSPCREAGYAAFQPGMRNDFYGNNRASDADANGVVTPDIGVHEFSRLDLGVTNWGQGQTAKFQVSMAAGTGAAAIQLSAAPAALAIQPFGVIGIDFAASITIGTVQAPGSVNLAIPNNPWLNGQYLYVQAFSFAPKFHASGTLDLGL